MANQSGLGSFLNGKGFPTESDDRAKRAASARLPDDDKENQKKQFGSTASATPVQKQSQTASAISKMTSNLKSNPVATPKTVTKSAIKPQTYPTAGKYIMPNGDLLKKWI